MKILLSFLNLGGGFLWYKNVLPEIHFVFFCIEFIYIFQEKKIIKKLSEKKKVRSIFSEINKKFKIK